MRTWFNWPPVGPHCPKGILEAGIQTVRFNDKKRVPVPVIAVAPHALARETGCPEGISARRTPRALA
jgi:hypothetical protein